LVGEPIIQHKGFQEKLVNPLAGKGGREPNVLEGERY